jgi:hypothetical protein
MKTMQLRRAVSCGGRLSPRSPLRATTVHSIRIERFQQLTSKRSSPGPSSVSRNKHKPETGRSLTQVAEALRDEAMVAAAYSRLDRTVTASMVINGNCPL